jgi:cellulose biosynthesis protein BcsQ
MWTIATAMEMGGSGKTTTVVNLAAALAETGQRVLVVECDLQANASNWLGVADAGKGIFAGVCEKEALRVDVGMRHGVEVGVELRRGLPGWTFQTAIREPVRLAEASSFGQPITTHHLKGAGSENYRALAVELLKAYNGAKHHKGRH